MEGVDHFVKKLFTEKVKSRLESGVRNGEIERDFGGRHGERMIMSYDSIDIGGDGQKELRSDTSGLLPFVIEEVGDDAEDFSQGIETESLLERALDELLYS